MKPLHHLAPALLLCLSLQAQARDNPLLSPSPLPLQYPRFDQLQDADFAPALRAGMLLQLRELEEILANPEPPSFANTVEAMERSGQTLRRASTVFFGLLGTVSNEQRLRLQREFAPQLAAHRDRIQLDPRLFARVDRLHAQRARLKLAPDQLKLLEDLHRNLLRAGAKLAPAQQDRLRALNAELAVLGADFNQRVLQGVNAAALRVETRAELAGLAEAEIDALRQGDGSYRLALLNTTGQPLLERLAHRPTRERLHRASIQRNQGGPQDTLGLVRKVLQLRAERAQLLGHATHADLQLADQTAKDVATVNGLLRRLAPAAQARAAREAAALQQLADREQDAAGQPRFQLEAWDWAFYTERLRAAEHGYDAGQLRPYLEAERVLVDGVFHSATRLFGLRFKRRPDLPRYHPDVQTWEVLSPAGKTQALLIVDLYARPSKRGGAWANAYVSQSHLLGQKPVVGLHLNVAKPKEGEPTLLSWDETNTLFHEFGHNLHALLSDVRYPSQSGTAVPRDFVEFPSQVYEMWQTWPSVFAHYARHHRTGEPMPKALLDKVLGARVFNQGFATSEYLAAALLDQRWHQLKADAIPEDLMAHEARVLREEGFSDGTGLVPPRYRTPYFSHFMGGYSAGYYSYIWAEVLDAQTVRWIVAHGGLDRKTGEHLKRHLFARGGSVPAMQLFEGLVGQKPDLQPLLERRGLK
ncbi:MAG: M3 family metallopeptidase [Burkholderiales bacterium]|nr:M3 family metallopeptidase [Burkholderiales bacterium]